MAQAGADGRFLPPPAAPAFAGLPTAGLVLGGLVVGGIIAGVVIATNGNNNGSNAVNAGASPVSP